MSDFKYVSDFEFPSDAGFSGSAGNQNVRGYMRGGKVASQNKSGKANRKRAMEKPMTPAMKGGHMKKAMGGKVKHVGGPNPEKEYPKSQARQKMPKNVKARGGRMVGVTTEQKRPPSSKPKANFTKAAKGGSMHDKLYAEGGKMGYAKGGQVKDTSGEFTMKSKAQPTMDSGTFPPNRGSNQAEVESGGRTRKKPRYKTGGKVKKTGEVAVARTKMITKRQKEHDAKMGRNKDKTKGKGMSRKGMPAQVKAKGGLARYANVSDATEGSKRAQAKSPVAPQMPRKQVKDKGPTKAMGGGYMGKRGAGR